MKFLKILEKNTHQTWENVPLNIAKSSPKKGPIYFWIRGFYSHPIKNIFLKVGKRQAISKQMMNKPEKVFGLQVRWWELDTFKILEIFWEIIWISFGFFWEFFFGIYLEKFFGRIFLRIFLGGFFGKICWEDFLKGILWEEVISRD